MAMTDLQILQAHGLFFVLGTQLHVFVFRKGEWDKSTTRLFRNFTLSIGLLTAALARGAPETFQTHAAALKTAGSLTATLIAGIYTSLLVYRAAFHRLNGFKGPFLARLSNLWITSRAVKELHMYTEVQQLHEQYGDIVRIGPTELSINNPKAVLPIHSNRSPCTKGPWYGVLHPMYSLQLVRDKQEHAQRRKSWDRGFSSKALRDYEFRVADYTNQLLANIDKNKGRPFNISDWFNFYSFDVMGDLAFGKSFGMLKEGIKHYFMTSLHQDMQAIGMFSHMLWLFPIFKNTPILNENNKRFWKFVTAQVDERIKNPPDRPDVFSWILEEYQSLKNPTWQDTLNLYGDAYLIIVAGSDTTAASLTCLFFELAQKPDVYQRVREEIDDYFAQNAEPEHSALSKLPYLQACIDETLRLHPPVPSGVQRMTPPEGIDIDGTFIPGDIIIQVPTHTMFRGKSQKIDERLFPQPNDFIPERWTTRPDLARDPAAFVPFGTGKYSCVGKQLGLMEIRYCASQIINRYDVAFAPGQKAEAFINGKKDGFTLSLPELEVIFKSKEGKVTG
ncbi:benzoate 4-monooxygenase cytochrome P450 [Colletotrichum phormii]|uniref:Benzoate 4-monooxygenase cytochrome P450 n=1 Tax=Colletotrichum phormii TaxID=359342 RepID=A0AAI9ZBC7_9PEZI|nr:benzoate 4-monooxygenase cytochrome P450 [Colletotrichum phormii]KAK1613515.1 benzoate 4-monooxygenase cytochrome P450 [Colletotrichum phormii]